MTKLHGILRPFVLRRIKADVEQNLPPKAEIVLYAAMTPEQRKIDQQLRDRTLHVCPAEPAETHDPSCTHSCCWLYV